MPNGCCHSDSGRLIPDPQYPRDTYVTHNGHVASCSLLNSSPYRSSPAVCRSSWLASGALVANVLFWWWVFFLLHVSMPMHAEHHVVVVKLSICLSVTSWFCWKCMLISSNYFHCSARRYSFLRATTVTKFKGQLSAWALNTRRWEKFAIFDQNHRLCGKPYEKAYGFYGSLIGCYR